LTLQMGCRIILIVALLKCGFFHLFDPISYPLDCFYCS
jgi:hypothetical protein